MIVNLQKTPLDAYAALIIHAKIDEMFDILMSKLHMKIPEFNLNRWLQIKQIQGQGDQKVIEVTGIDANGSPY